MVFICSENVYRHLIYGITILLITFYYNCKTTKSSKYNSESFFISMYTHFQQFVQFCTLFFFPSIVSLIFIKV